MCKKPLKLKNPRYLPNDPFSQMFVTVPCGKCDECHEQRTKEVCFRADYEYSDSIKKGGSPYFLTLTFNDANLNYVTYESPEGDKSCSTWNNVLLQKFTKNLSMKLRRLGYSLSYLVTAERGKNGTHRPHYHLLLFVIPTNGKSSLDRSTFLRYVCKYWSTSPSNEYRVLYDGRACSSSAPVGTVYLEDIDRTQVNCINYVTKYAYKSHNDVIFSVPEESIIKSRFPIPFYKMLPRSFMSQGFGLSFVDGVSPDQMPDFFANHVNVQANGSRTNIPRYFVRKFLYDRYTLLKENITDNRKYFNGKTHEYKFKNQIRQKISTTQIRSKLGDKFLSDTHRQKATLLHDFIRGLSYDKFLSFASPSSAWLSPSLARSIRTYLPNEQFFNSATSYLGSMPLSRFIARYGFVLHFGVNPNSTTYHDDALLSLFLDLFSVYNQYNSHVNFMSRQIQYKNNILNAVENNPRLFVPKD